MDANTIDGVATKPDIGPQAAKATQWWWLWVVIIVGVIILIAVFGTIALTRARRTGNAGRLCLADSDCTVGQACINHYCSARVRTFCENDGQCAPDLLCVRGQCTRNQYSEVDETTSAAIATSAVDLPELAIGTEYKYTASAMSNLDACASDYDDEHFSEYDNFSHVKWKGSSGEATTTPSSPPISSPVSSLTTPVTDAMNSTPLARGPRGIMRRRERFRDSRRQPRVHFNLPNAPQGNDFNVLEGDVREEFARRIPIHDTAAPPEVGEDESMRAVDDAEARDEFGIPLNLLAPMAFDSGTTAAVPLTGVSLPRGVTANGDLQSMLPPSADKDIRDMAFLERGPVYLFEETGDLLLANSQQQLTYLPTDRAVESLSAFQGRLLGVSDGVLYELDVRQQHLPEVAHWREVLTPTRQIVHVSGSRDGQTLVVQDPWNRYTLDSDMRVIKTMNTEDLRFLGATASEFADVTPAGDMITSYGGDGRGVVRVVFPGDGRVVVLSRREHVEGVRGIYTHNGNLFYITRGVA